MNALTDPAAARAAPGGTAASVELAVITDPAGIEALWRGFERHAAGHVFQTFDWIAAWLSHVGAARGIAPRIVLGTWPDGRPALILPLGIGRARGLSTLMFLGGDEADYQAGLFDPALLEVLAAEPDAAAALLERILALSGAVDLVHIQRQPVGIGGHPNPLLQLGGFRNPARTHATWLGEDWTAYYRAKRGAGWRRFDRNKRNRLEDLGPVRFVVAEDSTTGDAILEALFSQKRQSLARMGTRDIFAPPEVRAHYRALSRLSWPGGPAHLCALTCGDRIAAANFSLVRGDTYYYLLHSYDIDRFGACSPGRLLMYEIMQWCIARGIPRFDFTFGDEPYKDLWCEQHADLHDCTLAVTARGRLAAAGARTAAGLKRAVKQSAQLTDLARRLRARLAGRPAGS